MNIVYTKEMDLRQPVFNLVQMIEEVRCEYNVKSLKLLSLEINSTDNNVPFMPFHLVINSQRKRFTPLLNPKQLLSGMSVVKFNERPLGSFKFNHGIKIKENDNVWIDYTDNYEKIKDYSSMDGKRFTQLKFNFLINVDVIQGIQKHTPQTIPPIVIKITNKTIDTFEKVRLFEQNKEARKYLEYKCLAGAATYDSFLDSLKDGDARIHTIHLMSDGPERKESLDNVFQKIKLKSVDGSNQKLKTKLKRYQFHRNVTMFQPKNFVLGKKSQITFEHIKPNSSITVRLYIKNKQNQ